MREASRRHHQKVGDIIKKSETSSKSRRHHQKVPKLRLAVDTGEAARQNKHPHPKMNSGAAVPTFSLLHCNNNISALTMSDQQQSKQLDEREESRLKRARVHWERGAEIEREHLETANATHRRYLQSTIESQKETLNMASTELAKLRCKLWSMESQEGLLRVAADEAVELHRELWTTRSELESVKAELATRPQPTCTCMSADDAGQVELMEEAVEHMKSQFLACEDAPKPRRFYYPGTSLQLPNHLHDLSPASLERAKDQVKQWVKERSKMKRAQQTEEIEEAGPQCGAV
jgi:hypothetical protein